MIVQKESDTKKVPEKFASSIPSSCVICLNGDLGAGKTTFSRYLIQSLIKNKLVSGEIPSPTFSLLQTYKFKKVLINHYDFYRLEKEEDLIELDYANSVSNGICLIEWANNFLNALPKNRIEINIDLISHNKRSIKFKFIGNTKKKELMWAQD